MSYKYLFGPVNSRRLGISLGVDLIPFKTCSLDCIYCECGTTTALTCDRKEYVDSREIEHELTDLLSKCPTLDYVTFAGSGEPTLNTKIGDLLHFIKKNFPCYKTALLTNGTLLYLPEVRDAVLPFDLICPSLDAISDSAFEKVNRPSNFLINQNVISGLIELSKVYKGMLWVEVFIIPGINDSPQELHLFKKTLQEIKPGRVQLNSLDRPGACEWVQPASPERLIEIAAFLSPLPVEIISRSGSRPISDITGIDIEESISSLIRRRPSTVEELAIITGKTINEITITLDILKCRSIIETFKVENKVFYRICR